MFEQNALAATVCADRATIASPHAKRAS